MELHRAQPVALLCRALAMRTEEDLSAVSRGPGAYYNVVSPTSSRNQAMVGSSRQSQAGC